MLKIKINYIFFNKLFNFILSLQTEINKIKLNIKFGVLKNYNYYNKFLNILKYYNKFLNLIYIKLNLEKKIRLNKNIIIFSSMLNIIDNSNGLTPVTIDDFF